MIEQNWSAIELNARELSENATLSLHSKLVLEFVLLQRRSFIPLYVVGILQSILIIQTVAFATARKEWTDVYRMAYGINSLVVCTCLLIGVMWDNGYVAIVGLLAVIFNWHGYWVSAAFAFERMLMDLFFYKLYGTTPRHAVIISIGAFLLVIWSYVLSMVYSRVASILFLSHLVGPGVVHAVAFIVTYISSMKRKYYLTTTPTSTTESIQMCLYNSRYFVAPLLIMISVIVSLASREHHWPLLFHLAFFLPAMNSFAMYILPSKANMHEFKTQSPCGQLSVKLLC